MSDPAGSIGSSSTERTMSTRGENLQRKNRVQTMFRQARAWFETLLPTGSCQQASAVETTAVVVFRSDVDTSHREIVPDTTTQDDHDGILCECTRNYYKACGDNQEEFFKLCEAQVKNFYVYMNRFRDHVRGNNLAKLCREVWDFVYEMHRMAQHSRYPGQVQNWTLQEFTRYVEGQRFDPAAMTSIVPKCTKLQENAAGVIEEQPVCALVRALCAQFQQLTKWNNLRAAQHGDEAVAHDLNRLVNSLLHHLNNIIHLMLMFQQNHTQKLVNTRYCELENWVWTMVDVANKATHKFVEGMKACDSERERAAYCSSVDHTENSNFLEKAFLKKLKSMHIDAGNKESQETVSKEDCRFMRKMEQEINEALKKLHSDGALVQSHLKLHSACNSRGSLLDNVSSTEAESSMSLAAVPTAECQALSADTALSRRLGNIDEANMVTTTTKVVSTKLHDAMTQTTTHVNAVLLVFKAIMLSMKNNAAPDAQLLCFFKDLKPHYEAHNSTTDANKDESLAKAMLNVFVGERWYDEFLPYSYPTADNFYEAVNKAVELRFADSAAQPGAAALPAPPDTAAGAAEEWTIRSSLEYGSDDAVAGHDGAAGAGAAAGHDGAAGQPQDKSSIN